MNNENGAPFTAHEEYRMSIIDKWEYDPADDGPEVYIIRLEHLAQVFDHIDETVDRCFKNF